MRRRFDSEAALVSTAAELAARWRAEGPAPLLVGLRGALGAGKTTWARALLQGLGHTGRVPSPTYTLVEEYALGALTVVHVDLYRLLEAAELELLGLRDRLERSNVWVLVEWPERVQALLERCDLVLQFASLGPDERSIDAVAQTTVGKSRLEALSDLGFR